MSNLHLMRLNGVEIKVSKTVYDVITGLGKQVKELETENKRLKDNPHGSDERYTSELEVRLDNAETRIEELKIELSQYAKALKEKE